MRILPLYGDDPSCPERFYPGNRMVFSEPLMGKPGSPESGGGEAFTLLELLVVMGILMAMMALLVPAVIGIKGGGDLTKVAYDIASALEQARAYAMANNTFVFVGIAEVDSRKNSSAAPQSITTPPAIGGRVAIASVATKDGTRGYSLADPSAWIDRYSNGGNLVAIGKLQYFENVTLIPKSSDSSGVNSAQGSSSCTSVTPFDWPLGKALNAGQYSFTTVIHFDPQGIARIQTSTNKDAIASYIQLQLNPTRGNTPVTSGNFAMIEVNGFTGMTRIFRP